RPPNTPYPTESFRRFAIHGDTRATGRDMNGKNWSKLCKDCGVIDGKGITLTDVDIVFSKVNMCQNIESVQKALQCRSVTVIFPVTVTYLLLICACSIF
uniref:Uncharacterized protein n=1 Tax=Cyprinus carpio TaxID=7962 RepID=A0A8C1Z6W3_CYPCA